MSSAVTTVYVLGATGNTGGAIVDALLERPGEFVSYSSIVQCSIALSTKRFESSRKLLPRFALHPQRSLQSQLCVREELMFILSILALLVTSSLSMNFVAPMLLYQHSSRPSYRSHSRKRRRRQASLDSSQATGHRLACPG